MGEKESIERTESIVYSGYLFVTGKVSPQRFSMESRKVCSMLALLLKRKSERRVSFEGGTNQTEKSCQRRREGRERRGGEKKYLCEMVGFSAKGFYSGRVSKQTFSARLLGFSAILLKIVAGLNRMFLLPRP